MLFQATHASSAQPRVRGRKIDQHSTWHTWWDPESGDPTIPPKRRANNPTFVQGEALRTHDSEDLENEFEAVFSNDKRIEPEPEDNEARLECLKTLEDLVKKILNMLV